MVWNIAVIAVVEALLAKVKVALLADSTVVVVVRNGEVAVVAADAEQIEWRIRESRHIRLCRGVEERRELGAKCVGVVLGHVLLEVVQVAVKTSELTVNVSGCPFLLCHAISLVDSLCGLLHTFCQE